LTALLQTFFFALALALFFVGFCVNIQHSADLLRRAASSHHRLDRVG
jgi:hypothetical protein